MKDHLVMPRTVRKIFVVRSFSVVGPVLWNNLPNYIKDSNNFDPIQKKKKKKKKKLKDILICK